MHINDNNLFSGYGMSELSMASHMPDLIDGQPFGSVGKVVSNLEMKAILSIIAISEE